MKQVSKQEAQLLEMMKKSTTMFPERKDFSKINDGAIGWAHRKRKTNPRLDTMTYDSINFSTQRMDSPTGS